MILHKRRVLEALQGNARRQVRRLLHLPQRAKADVLDHSLENAVERHTRICRTFLQLAPEIATGALKGASVCEIGAGDCLTTSALFIGLGASHVTLVELKPPTLTRRQVEVVRTVREQGLPLDDTILKGEGEPELDAERVSYHQELMERFDAPPAHDYIFSYCVLEHVEDLPAMFQTCLRILKPGGKMMHVIDLGGHSQFEDPLPPLDFQTYSNWLYDLMFPPGYRATRRFLGEYVDAAAGVGFVQVETQALRTIEGSELEKVKPLLRSEAQARPTEELATIEFVLTGNKAPDGGLPAAI